MKLRHFLSIFILVCIVFTIGTFGYHSIEGWSYLDSFYMTAITLTTVGFGEVHGLSDTGRIFTLFLLFTGVGLVTYSISTFISYITSFDFEKRRADKMKKKIDKLSGHTVVCGYGRMGRVICEELSKNNAPFVVIEKDEHLVNELKKTNFYWIEGDATHDEALLAAGLGKASVMVSMVNNDSDTLYISLAGRSLNPDLHIIARATDRMAKSRILRAGADKVVLPLLMSGLQVAESVLNPAVEDFLDLTYTSDGKTEQKIQIADLFVTTTSKLINSSLHDKGAEMSDLIIVGIRKKDKSFIFKPKSGYIFQDGDCLITMGTRESYKKAKEHFNLSSVTPL